MMESQDHSPLVQEYLQNLLIGNRSNCSAIAHQFLNQNHTIQELYEEVFKQALYEVGRLWETNQITVATEHLATAITESILNELFEQIISGKKFNKKVVVACVEGEYHQVGIKMVADVFEIHGWDSFFPGTGMPINALVQYISEIKPDLLAISMSVYFSFANLRNMLEQIRANFPDLQILVGGQAFTRITDDVIKRLGNVVQLSDLYLLEKYIDAINITHNN